MDNRKYINKADNTLRKFRHSGDRDLGLTGGLNRTTPVDRISGPVDEAFQDDQGIGEVLGSATGEVDRDITAGGWAGTDDATSTAPSDLADEVEQIVELGPDAAAGRAYAGGLAPHEGGVTDLTGMPVEESRDWITDAILPRE